MSEDQQLIEQLRCMVLAPGRSFRYREDVATVAEAADRLEASLKDRDGWKTIDSAPKGMTPILLFGNRASWAGGVFNPVRHRCSRASLRGRDPLEPPSRRSLRRGEGDA